MIFNWKKWLSILALSGAALFASYEWGNSVGTLKEQARHAEEIKNDYIKRSEASIEKHNAVQAALDSIGKDYAEKMEELEGSTDRIIADLNRDNKRLRIKLKPSTGSQSPGNQCIPTVDGRAELDEGDAKRLISVTQRGDQWIKSLQDTVVTLQDALNDKQGGAK